MTECKTTLRQDWWWLWRYGCNHISITKEGIMFNFNRLRKIKKEYLVGVGFLWKQSALTNTNQPEPIEKSVEYLQKLLEQDKLDDSFFREYFCVNKLGE